ncbi:MAG: hypothetical protein DRN17_03630 [Thermoplasmata archaeon]|nr:MAG: hypothetical protein DRN17_03630 [Thermoplasmata archaeon]
MPDPLTTAGFAIAGKKTFIGVLGMAAAVSDDMIKIWPLVAVLLVPIATGAYYMGVVSNKLTTIAENGRMAHENMHNNFMSELAARDIKIDLSYSRATKGKRYTFDMGMASEERIRLLEAAVHEPSRFEQEGKELELRIDSLESRLYRVELDAHTGAEG